MKNQFVTQKRLYCIIRIRWDSSHDGCYMENIPGEKCHQDWLGDRGMCVCGGGGLFKMELLIIIPFWINLEIGSGVAWFVYDNDYMIHFFFKVYPLLSRYLAASEMNYHISELYSL